MEVGTQLRFVDLRLQIFERWERCLNDGHHESSWASTAPTPSLEIRLHRHQVAYAKGTGILVDAR
jgi:hypothetical protein